MDVLAEFREALASARGAGRQSVHLATADLEALINGIDATGRQVQADLMLALRWSPGPDAIAARTGILRAAERLGIDLGPEAAANALGADLVRPVVPADVNRELIRSMRYQQAGDLASAVGCLTIAVDSLVHVVERGRK